MFIFKDDWARDQISIGLKGQPPKNMALMNPQFSLQIWIGDDLRSISTQNNVGQLSKMAELDTGGCSWRPIDIWALAKSSLRVVLHCFRWKCSWRHPLSIFETKNGCSLGSGFLEAVHGGQLIFGRYLTLINPPFSFHIWIGDGLGSSLRPNTPCLYSKMTELETKYQLASRDSLHTLSLGMRDCTEIFRPKRPLNLLFAIDF